MHVFRLLTLALSIAPVSLVAAPITLFDDDFAAEVAGATSTVSVLNFSALANFDIVDGAVDLFTNGGFGLPCGSAGCLDLDGSVLNAARLESKVSFSFVVGADYVLSLAISGKNGNGPESLTFGLLGGPSGSVVMPRGDSGARIATLNFTAASSFVDKLFIDHADGDNQGILLDRVTLTENRGPGTAPIPLPAALPLALAGLGLLAGVTRIRR